LGAAGRFGTCIIDKLLQRGMVVRALVRVGSSYAHLENRGIGFFSGDLLDRECLKKVCAGTSHLIATANTAAQTRKGDTFKAVDTDGY
jgi:uncharacterized protein YbjT (DUF2867 family)